ncbi:MAG: trypsin-like peptidase domain-containing protein [Pseudopelagicola sp.]|nr:trypsin-like peptidase domain-containing protein [Pseudopelagicola sp.]
MRVVIAMIVACVAALPAFGEEGLRALRSRGDLIGWEAVGRVALVGKGYCTGALISSDLVLTAAHCVYDDAGRPIPPERIRFEAGYVAGSSLAARQVDRVVAEEGYVPSTDGKIATNMMRHDIALLRLAFPISVSEASPFALYDSPQTGDRVSVLSYGQGRSEHLSWQRTCSILARGRGLMSFDCDITYGSSGAPVFARYGNRVRILSLVSAMGRDRDGRKVGYGMELPQTVARLKARMRGQGLATVRGSLGARRITVGGARKPTGAKFLRVD